MFQEDEEQDLMPIDRIEESHMQLAYQIQEISEEKDALKLITQNQLKNINELQVKCEESFIAINQLPENRNAASDRYHEAMTEITKLQNKQLEINELLNLSLKEFDNNMQLSNNAKLLFDSEINIANQRRLIYQSSLNEIKNLGQKNITNMKESINGKSALLETVTNHLNTLNIVKISLEDELKQMTEKKSTINLMNNGLQEQCSEVEEQVRKFSEEMQTLVNDMLSKQDILNCEIENLKLELETSNNDLQQLDGELNSTTAKIEQQQNESVQFKNKLNEAMMLSSNLKSSVESRRTELNGLQTESEKRKIEIANLKNLIKEIGVLSTKCSEKEAEIKELTTRKDFLMNQTSALQEKLKLVNEKIVNDKVKYSAAINETKKNKDTLITITGKTDQQQKDLDKLKKSTQDMINCLSEEIKQLTVDNEKIIESITLKKTTIDDQQKEVASLKLDLKEKKAMLTEKQEKNKDKKEDVTKKLEEAKMKKECLIRELQDKKNSIDERKKFNESIKKMHEKIASEKEKYELMKKTFAEEKMELQSSCTKRIEEKIQELQTIKSEKVKQWETVRDRAGKVEYSYYKAKSQAQKLKAEVRCINENLKIYSCENEMLKMLIGWINNDVSASDAESLQSKSQDNPGVLNEIPLGSVKSDSSFDEEAENEDIVVQQYYKSRVHVPGTSENKASCCLIERPIMISNDDAKENVQDISISSEESEPSRPSSFYQAWAKQNTERKTIKHKIQDTAVKGRSHEDSVMKRPKTPQKKIFTKTASTKSRKKINETPKKKTILDMVIDSSSN